MFLLMLLNYHITGYLHEGRIFTNATLLALAEISFIFTLFPQGANLLMHSYTIYYSIYLRVQW